MVWPIFTNPAFWTTVVGALGSAAQGIGGSGKKGGDDAGGIPAQLLPLAQALSNTGVNASQQFPSLFQFMDPGFLQRATEQGNALSSSLFNIGAGAAPGLFGKALSGFEEGMSTGFAPDILSSIEQRLRPMAEYSKDILKADVLEGAAGLGQARSSGTVESLGRGFSNIEAGLQSMLGQIEGTLAPLALQTKAAFTQGGLGIGSILQNILAPGLSQGLGIGQFGATLPFQAASAIGALPFIAPQAGGKK